jgi:hypothetical protein
MVDYSVRTQYLSMADGYGYCGAFLPLLHLFTGRLLTMAATFLRRNLTNG